LVRARLKLISMQVDCDCGAKFLAEDLKPQCPFCDRVYSVEVVGAKGGFKLRVQEVDHRNSLANIDALSDSE